MLNVLTGAVQGSTGSHAKARSRYWPWGMGGRSNAGDWTEPRTLRAIEMWRNPCSGLTRAALSLCRPSGARSCFLAGFPPLSRWATLCRPSGAIGAGRALLADLRCGLPWPCDRGSRECAAKPTRAARPTGQPAEFNRAEYRHHLLRGLLVEPTYLPREIELFAGSVAPGDHLPCTHRIRSSGSGREDRRLGDPSEI